MAYSDFAPHHRWRRRRNVVLLIVLVVIIGVVTLAVRYRTERRESIDYLAVAADMGRSHADIADELGMLLQGLGGGDRPDMELRLDTMAGNARQLADTLAEQVVPRPVSEASGLMVVAASSWADGIADVGQAINAILDGDESEGTGDANLRSAFDLIRVGDRAYARGVAAMAKLDPEIVPTEFPDVSYTEGVYAPLYDAAAIADRLRQQGTLAKLVDVKLVGLTDPEPVSESDAGIWTIPASDSLSLQVKVSNTGNVTAENITVLVTLQRVGSAETIEPVSQLIPSIDPGQSEILDFENLAAEPGAVYSLTATATVADVEDPTDDNTFSLVFQRNTQ
jgi:hypothetical protein